MKKIRLAFLVLSIGAIAACSTTTRNPAPVVDRAPAAKTAEGSRAAATAKILPKPADAHGYYTVRKGDTLIHIALEFGQNYRDLVAWNNLANANDIKVDQLLRVLPPEAGPVPGGTQTGSVATSSGVEVRALPTPATATPASAAPAASATNKTVPRGDKRLYSEAALAELQKPDASPAAALAITAGRTETPKGAESKMSDRAVDATAAVIAEDENLSWIWPAEGKVVATFDEGKKGIDIAGKIGQQVLAAGSGKVMYAGSGIRGYGNLVIVKHTSNLLSAYAHNKTVLVKEGQSVSKGQKIAEMGNSDTDAVKLHFEIRQQGKPVDPSKFLPNR